MISKQSQSKHYQSPSKESAIIDIYPNLDLIIINFIIILMLKPKTHTFKLKAMLYKLEIVNNKVASRCHAFLKIQNEEISFKISPQLKKNMATFNAEVQYESFSIYFDEITGMYENKSALVLFQIETQGTKIKIGEVQLNLGAVLNEKKYRIVNTLPLAKCYDKTAKAKISVDFIPISAPAEQLPSERKEKKEYGLRENLSAESERITLQHSPSGNAWKQSNYKSRLAEESNFILQEKIYEYQQKMDNYRLSQTQLQEKLHEQITNKDEHISELTIELNRKNQHISTLNLQGEQLKYRMKELGEELANTKETNRSLMIMIENLQHEQEDLKKECMSLRASLENQGKTKENKEKYFTQELGKYTQRYLQSEQERNKIVFELQSKFKQEIEKKESNYRLLIASSDKKHNQAIQSLKERVKGLQNQLSDKCETIERQVLEIKKISDLLSQKTRDFNDEHKKYQELYQKKETLQKNYSNQSNELQTLNFSYQQQERQVSQLRDELNINRKSSDQLRMELMMANQTIQEQRKSLTKYSKEIQVHQQRQYYLTQKYNDELQMKSYNQENIRGESLYYRDQYYKLKNQLRISEERGQEETHKNQQLKQAIHRIQMELTNKNQAMIRLGEERIMIETENRNLKNELAEIQEALLLLKEENLQLNDYLREKKIALENDKSLEWSYKIEELQLDISEMLEKFRVEKDLLKDNFKKEDSKRRQEISFLNNQLKKSKEENEQFRRILVRKETQFKDHGENYEQLRFAAKEKIEELSECKEKMRIYMAEIQELESRVHQLQQNERQKVKEVEERYQKQLKSMKKIDIVKSNMNKIITNLLEYLTKPFSSTIVYQQINSSDIDVEIANMINISIKKYCEERNKVKETIKRLQNEASQTKIEPKNNDKELLTTKYQEKYQQKRFSTEINDSYSVKRNFFKEGDMEGNWKYQTNQRTGAKDNFEIDSFRDENARLKRQISQLRVKIKNLEDDVIKAERNTDNERYAKQATKHEMEELQDELQKISFQLKRKEKIIIEYESEMKDLQTEVLAAKNIQSLTAPKQTSLSRSEIRGRDKEESTQHNRNAIIIRDLQGKLQQRMRESEEQSIETNKLKNEVSTLNEVINNFKSQIKIYEAKLKEKTAKIANLDDQLSNLRANTEQEYQREGLKQQKIINNLQEQVATLQQECNRSHQAIISLEKQVEDLEKKLKLTKQQSRLNETRVKRQNEAAQAKLKQTIQQLQHQILTLNSELEQVTLKNKELSNKNASLNALISKKTEELERHITAISSKNNKIAQLQENIEEMKLEYDSKVNQLLEKGEQLETALLQKDYELQEYRFTAQGRIMDLQKQLQEASK